MFLPPKTIWNIKSRRKEENEDNKHPVKESKNYANISVNSSAWPSSAQNKTDQNIKNKTLKQNTKLRYHSSY